MTKGASYDNASQLTGLLYANRSSTLGNLTYGYDLNGRRTNIGGSFATTNLPNAVSTTAYNANNQLTSWGTANLFYDVNGNMTSDGTHSYAWDARNHLKQVDSGTTASFIYDPFGRRTSKTILSTQTGFLYDGVNPVQELSGTTVTANSLMGSVDEAFQRTDSVGARSFLTDSLGSSIALADSSGTIQTQYTFDPFGNTTLSGSSTTNSFAYTGRELDTTGLYFYRARYYNPQLQRFISEDPLAFGGGDANFYAYVHNDPVNLFDPFGLRPGDKYPNAKCAGYNAVNDYNQTSIDQNKEYGGYVYENPDGTFSYTDPSVNGNAGIGDDSTIPRFWQIPIPSGTQRGGWYHTHGAQSSEINNDFSPDDKRISDVDLGGMPGFLGTPKPEVRMYIPSPDNPGNGISFPLNGRNCGCHK